ncbi:RNA polymerase sigma factor [Paraglaciecola sp.]|uniref:RNA polymerase sigma factor n=1 Tax=Paraglaciecola sp. TaxID=1920173 RepID=UPI003EFADC57
MSREFLQIMDEHAALLGRVAATYEANFHLRQELLQEITLAVWQSLEKFKAQSSIKTYILKVAHNKAVTHVTYQAKLPRNDSYCEVHEPAANSEKSAEIQVQQQQKIETLLEEIRHMPIQSRQIVTMSMEGLSYTDIAEASGVTKSNVGVILNRTRAALMERVNHDE